MEDMETQVANLEPMESITSFSLSTISEPMGSHLAVPTSEERPKVGPLVDNGLECECGISVIFQGFTVLLSY